MQRILNVIGWIGTAMVIAALALILRGPAEWYHYAKWMAWGGLVLVLLYPIVNWREVVGQFSRRQAKYASVAVTSVLVIFGILILLNYLSYRRFNKRWDLTANAVHSLSDQSVKVLSGLDAPLKMTLVDRGDRFGNFRERLAMYPAASRQVSVDYLDGELDPVKTKQFDVQAFPTLVLQYKGKTEKVLSIEEREITSAVIRVISGKQRKVYFVQGHGEYDPAGDSQRGYKGVAQLLKGDNFTVETLALNQKKDIPDDATAVIIAGPQTDLLDDELEQVKRYMDKGGKLMLLLDPTVGQRAQPLTKLIALAKDWGINVGNDVVIDTATNRPEIVVAQAPYPSHPITQAFRIATAFPLARSVSAAMPPPQGKTVQSFVQSGTSAWAETDLKGLEAQTEPKAEPDKGDKVGPVSVAVAANTPAPPDDPKADASKTPPQSRVVVFGDSDFASDAFAGQLGNADLFLNAVSWLTAQENLISIRPKEPGNSKLTMTPTQITAVNYSALLGIPALIFIAGIVAWSRRRRA
jgi:ABC-type uncharacterized transport system involved in gliding motility auxiliary subunit